MAAVWLACLLFVLLLLLVTTQAHGQDGSVSAPTPLRQSLSEAEQTLTLLSARLAERRQQVSDLQASLARADERLIDLAASYESLRQTLGAAQSSLAQSQTDLTATSSSLEALSARYVALEISWQAYRDEMVTQVVTLEREAKRARRWAVVFGVGTAVGFIVSVVLALR